MHSVYSRLDLVFRGSHEAKQSSEVRRPTKTIKNDISMLVLLTEMQKLEAVGNNLEAASLSRDDWSGLGREDIIYDAATVSANAVRVALVISSIYVYL